jgi:signal transduction histidine kinase/ActR/RegA family two-component response regulator
MVKVTAKTSLSKKFVDLMRMFILWFIIGASILLVTLNILNKNYISKRDDLRAKQQLAQQINNDFDQALFDVRGYIAYGNVTLKNSALSEEPKIRELVEKFEKNASSKEDKQLVQKVRSFSQWYFKDTLPNVISAYETGDREYVTIIANSQGTEKVTIFRKYMENYLQLLNTDLENHYKSLIQIQTYIQVVFVFFILAILLLLLRIVRVMLRQIGQPLSELANAAEKIANGEHADIHVNHHRSDEIGALSSAFQTMVEKVQEKEHALRNRNDELNELFHHSEDERKQNQAILHALQEGVQLIDHRGGTIKINKKLCELIDCEEHTIVGMDWEQWTSYMVNQVEEDDFVDKAERILQPLSEKEKHSFIYTLKQTRKVIKVYCEGLYEAETRKGTVLVHRDITKEFEVDQMKSEFVSTVSHELRTPLASILGFTELMLQRELKPERKEKYLMTILNEAKRLTALINDFLDIQRMEAGKQSYEKKYIELLPILEKIIEVQQISTARHQISLESLIENPIILGDKAKLEQVFTNLINNAIKYSPEGGPIQVKIGQFDDELNVSVTDYGLGIPKDGIDKLFTKFYRIDNSDRRKIGGTGLGLAIVHEIVKSHNGEITVESEYGKGSTFTTTFPAVQTSQEKIELDGFKEKANGFKILIVEDDQSLADLICQELWDSGFSTTYYKNGTDTMEYLKEEIPDAIVLDILLEDDRYDGWKIMNEVKQSERLKNIPIIVSTALDEKEKGLSLGAMDFLVKPYKPSHLSKAIMQTLLKVGKVGQILVPEDTNKKH